MWILVASSAITLLGLLEYNKLTILKSRDGRADFLAVLGGVVVPYLVYSRGPSAIVPALLFLAFIFFVNSFFAGEREMKDAAFDVSFKTFGIVYIAVPFSFFALISGLKDGPWWIIFLFAVIWSNDTFAYVTGRKFGKRKLCPSISPGKSVEGAVGGLIGGFVAALLVNRFAALGMGFLSVLVLSFVLGVVGIAGDLAESVLKRGAGVKDSGSIVPGHGGVLDRTDSLLFTIPVLYYFLVTCNAQAMAG